LHMDLLMVCKRRVGGRCVEHRYVGIRSGYINMVEGREKSNRCSIAPSSVFPVRDLASRDHHHPLPSTGHSHHHTLYHHTPSPYSRTHYPHTLPHSPTVSHTIVTASTRLE
jgi:hypothetical protein